MTKLIYVNTDAGYYSKEFSCASTEVVILERDGVFIIARGIVSWDDSELDASFDEWIEYEERYKDGCYKIVDTNK